MQYSGQVVMCKVPENPNAVKVGLKRLNKIHQRKTERTISIDVGTNNTLSYTLDGSGFVCSVVALLASEERDSEPRADRRCSKVSRSNVDVKTNKRLNA